MHPLGGKGELKPKVLARSRGVSSDVHGHRPYWLGSQGSTLEEAWSQLAPGS